MYVRQVLTGVQVEIRSLQQCIDRTQDQRQGRAQLMAHVREEDRLRAIELREHVRSLLLILDFACARDRAGDVADDEAQEVHVVIVQLAPRTDSGDQIATGALPRCDEGENDDLPNRLGPRPRTQRAERCELRIVQHDQLVRHRPSRIGGRSDVGRRGRRAFRKADARGERQARSFVGHVQERER